MTGPPRAPRGRLLAIAVAAYVLLIALWLGLRLVAFDRVWWLALLNTFAIALFAPVAALLPLAAWRRRWRLCAALGLPLAAFAWLYGGMLLPRAARPAPAGPTLTVMTLNVLWPNEEYGRIAAAIEDADADIVALQELRPQHLPAIQAALGAAYPYEVFSPREQFHRVGLLSRYPVESVAQLDNPPFERAILVRLRAGGRPLTVVVAHLTPTNMLDDGVRGIPAVVARRYARRLAQARALVALARSEGQPVIVACDCNATSTSEAYAALREGFADSFATAGWGLGLTMRAPVASVPALRLDYIWHTTELRALDARVGADAGSDHLPVVARLAWP